MKTLIVDYLKLGLVFGPLVFVYTLWDARHHPIADPELLRLRRPIEYVRVLALHVVLWHMGSIYRYRLCVIDHFLFENWHLAAIGGAP
jgi:hypothetical protein